LCPRRGAVQQEQIVMRKIHIVRSQQRRIVRLFATAVLAATLVIGYAGLRVTPAIHATASHVMSHMLLADSCQSGVGHC
jgi:hypothetical protein